MNHVTSEFSNHGLQFEDATTAAGVAFSYSTGADAKLFALIESLGGGSGVFDFDGDGQLDIVLSGGGRFPAHGSMEGLATGLFRQVAPLKFDRLDPQARMDRAPFYSHGLAVGDYDEDGFDDLLVTGSGGLQLWHNLGDGTFQELAQRVGLVDSSWSSSAAWGDLNGDGLLDLYVAHYVDWSWKNDPPCPGPKPHGREICGPNDFEGLDDIIFYSNGDGTYRNAVREAGLSREGKGLGVLMSDLDLDGDVDLYVANDEVLNFLYINDGQGHLAEEATLRGAAGDDAGLANGSMGVDICDFNRDGKFDLWVSNYERELFALYRNDGAAHYSHVSRSTGISALPQIFVGFGTVATDLNRDGYEDVVVVNGHVLQFPQKSSVRQETLVMLNDRGRFKRGLFPPTSYFSQPHTGRGLAAGDLDEDGDLDLVIANQEEPAVVLRNESETKGSWVGLRLIGTRSGRNAIGTTLTLHTSEGDQIRQVKGGGSYLSHCDRRVQWGVPHGAQPLGLVIRWISGLTQELPAPEVGKWHTLLEPSE